MSDAVSKTRLRPDVSKMRLQPDVSKTRLQPDVSGLAPERPSKDDVCEVRVPTYRRPKLLQRALRSVIGQTCDRWRCIVFDDCPDASARGLVEQIGDPRITYVENPRPAGAIGNIDQCFRNAPYVGGSHACVVEDDNYLLPEHLARQLAACADWNVDVVFSAQLCEEIIEPGEPGRLSHARTIASIYAEGRHDAAEVLPALLYSNAFSNGAVFWRLGARSNFEIGPVTRRPGVQETARILRLAEPVYVSHTPTAVWRSNDPRDSYVSDAAGHGHLGRVRAQWRRLLERREIMELRRAYLATHGIDQATRIAARDVGRRADEIESTLLMCGKPVRLTSRSSLWRLSWLLRGAAFRLIVPCQLAPPRTWAFDV